MTALAVGSYQLCWRALRETIRQPGVEVSNLFIPLFFFFVTVGAISNVAGPAFGVDNYEGFQLPVAVLQCVAGSASVSGIALIRDIESGYFDKLLLTPSPRLAIVLGRLFADAIRAIAFTAVILFVVSLVGAGMEAGPFGYAVILALAGLFGLAYSGIGATIALRTGNAQAAQAGIPAVLPAALPLPRLRAEGGLRSLDGVPRLDQPGDLPARGHAHAGARGLAVGQPRRGGRRRARPGRGHRRALALGAARAHPLRRRVRRESRRSV